MNRLDFTLLIIAFVLYAFIALVWFQPAKKTDLPPIINQPVVLGKGWSPNVQNQATTSLQSQEKGFTKTINPQTQSCYRFGNGDNLCP